MTAKRFVSTLGILSGGLCFEGTRVSVEHVARRVAAGEHYDVLLEDYSSLTREDLDAAHAWWKINRHADRTVKPLRFVRLKKP